MNAMVEREMSMVSKTGLSNKAGESKDNERTYFDTLPSNFSQMEKMAAIGQLSSSVAHEMRNLMGMIRTASFNINRAIQSQDPTISNNLEIITRSVNRAKEYIDNLLDLSRIPKGNVEIIDVCSIVDGLLNLFSKEFEWRHIQLNRKYSPVPLYHLDRNILQECLLNLILNAIQSMDEGGYITVTVEPWQQGVKISVSDTGCGISPNQINKIFDRFYTTKKNGQGTGLGLTIVHSLVSELGGEIQVQSKINIGSTFSICLPNLTKENSTVDSDNRYPELHKKTG